MRETLTTSEMLDLLGISRTTMYRWIEEGVLFAQGGVHGAWSHQSVARAKKVRKFLDRGFTMVEIKRRLNVS
jgi:predicted site-specific integrase-resolvase